MSVRKSDRQTSPTEYWMYCVRTLYPYFSEKLSHVSKQRQRFTSRPLLDRLTQIKSQVSVIPFCKDGEAWETASNAVKGLLSLEPLLYGYWLTESVPRKDKYKEGANHGNDVLLDPGR